MGKGNKPWRPPKRCWPISPSHQEITMPTILLALTLVLSAKPGIHDDVRQVCPPMAAMVQMHRDAGPTCVLRWTAHQQQRMNTQLQELSRTLQRFIHELKVRQHPET
jgi:hypothetical protein